jgi:hypothetical protein
MVAKTFEVRDDGTFIPVLAVKLTASNDSEKYLIARAGFGTAPTDHVLLSPLRGEEKMHFAPSAWGGSRTLGIAHRYIRENFDDLDSGAVIDVELILGETFERKTSERFSGGGGE